MEQETPYKPIIGISIGDINGIGPEVILKALNDSRILSFMTPVVYGSTKILSYYKKAANVRDVNYSAAKASGQFLPGKVNVVNCWDTMVEIKIGEETAEAGQSAFISLEKATDALIGGEIDALVTAPINKNNIQQEDFQFPGHTEYLTKKLNAKESLMLLVSGDLRVGVITGHIPLKDVAGSITQEALAAKFSILEKSLKKDFNIRKPKIAILGLNPHAGENGLLGQEEKQVIEPFIQQMKEKGKLAFGPFPADGFFGSGQFKQYDGILAMYHDQGLIPFKTLAFESGVNFTAGLSGIRTSPDHGTAYNIAGKGIADATSMREAIYLACDIFKHRREQQSSVTVKETH